MAKKGNRKQADCNYFLGNKQIIEPKSSFDGLFGRQSLWGFNSGFDM